MAANSSPSAIASDEKSRQNSVASSNYSNMASIATPTKDLPRYNLEDDSSRRNYILPTNYNISVLYILGFISLAGGIIICLVGDRQVWSWVAAAFCALFSGCFLIKATTLYMRHLQNVDSEAAHPTVSTTQRITIKRSSEDEFACSTPAKPYTVFVKCIEIQSPPVCHTKEERSTRY